MKKGIRSVMAAVAGLCLFVALNPNLLNNSGFNWNNRNSLSRSHNFYFAKRQWLADARTVVAAIRYLYQSSAASPTNPAEVVTIPHQPPLRPLTTNFIGMAQPAPAVPKVQGA
jgi:hypothetical protein